MPKSRPASPQCVLESWPIRRLKPNPRQVEFYRPLTDEQLDKLAKKCAREGMPPIDILPDGTILDGEQRWRAAKRHKLKQVPVRIHYELEGDDQAALQYFLTANEDRHHHTLLQRVRLELAKLENESVDIAGVGQVKLCKLIGSRLNVHFKTVEREYLLLSLDSRLVDAYEADLLPRNLVMPLGKLPAKTLAKLWPKLESQQDAADIRPFAKQLLAAAKPKRPATAAKDFESVNAWIGAGQLLLNDGVEFSPDQRQQLRELAVQLAQFAEEPSNPTQATPRPRPNLVPKQRHILPPPESYRVAAVGRTAKPAKEAC
jgi:ParB-like chromosome segregation protein Spo0J